MRKRFSLQLKRQADSIWRAIYRHPFLGELRAGTLPLKRFTYFILQDYLYLLDFAQVLCLAGAKSSDLATLEIFTRHALAAVEVERSFHASFGKSLGLPERALDRTPKGPTTEAYTKHLQAIARSGTLGENVAALLPCYWIYGQVGRMLYRGRPKRPPAYRRWIEVYASEEYWKLVREQIRLVDLLGARAGSEERRSMGCHFLLSSRYEFLFWEQAYRLEGWPV